MTDLHITLVGDGPSDSGLLRPIVWLLKEHVRPAIAIQPEWADLSALRIRPATLSDRVRFAVELYPCDILFVHRDAERDALETRRAEVDNAIRSLRLGDLPVVKTIPVRMHEAWLLFDEPAIRQAVGNPNGRVRLEMPQPGIWDQLPDPKKVLHDLLRAASELRGRRLRKFNAHQYARRVADCIENFAPLRQLAAFQTFEDDVRNQVDAKGWGRPITPAS